MTLVAVWKPAEGALQVATDSRLSFGSAGRADVGGKLALLPAQIFDATPQGARTPPLLLRRTYGVAVVGSAVTSHKVLELLRVVLAGVQIAPGISQVSLADAAEFALSALRSVVVPITAVMEEKGLAQLILVGHCPIHSRAQAFIISVDANMTASCSEIDLSGGPYFFGTPSAVASASQLASVRNPLPPHRILRQLCDSPAHLSVGGTVQYGAVVEADFAIYGSLDYEVDHIDRVVYVRYFASGVELSQVMQVLNTSGLLPRYRYVSLFESDILKFEQQGFRVEYSY